jgi:tRNA(fMet)-specific endonuclease VapC
MNGTPPAVRSRFDTAMREKLGVYISSIVAFELWYGIAKSARIEINTRRFTMLLSSPVVALPFENQDSRAAGSIRATLEAAGKPIGAYDYLIAGQALARQLTLVTANVSEFSRVKGLSWQDWAKP